MTVATRRRQAVSWPPPWASKGLQATLCLQAPLRRGIAAEGGLFRASFFFKVGAFFLKKVGRRLDRDAASNLRLWRRAHSRQPPLLFFFKRPGQPPPSEAPTFF